MDQNNTYQFRKADLFVDMSSDNYGSEGPFQQKEAFSKNLSDDLRFSKISMDENKNNHSDYYGRRGFEQNGEFRSFQIGLDRKSQRIRLEPLVSKTRNRTTPDQLMALESVCKTTMRPNKEMRIKLANKLNMNQRQVQIWFQNKRAKTKKQSKNAREKDALGLQKDGRVHQPIQGSSVPQGFPSPERHSRKEQFFHTNDFSLTDPINTMFLTSNPLYPSQPASSSYLKNYCSLGNFYPRQQDPNVFEGNQIWEQYDVPYCVDMFPEMATSSSRQRYESRSRDYLIDRDASRMSKMYCSRPKNPYQNYNSYNNKQF